MLCWYLSPLATFQRIIARALLNVTARRNDTRTTSRIPGARRPLFSNWAATGIALPVKTPEFLRCMAAWIADQGRSMDRSFVPWNPPSPPRWVSEPCFSRFPLHPVKEKIQTMNTRVLATRSTAGGLTERSKAGETLVSGRWVETLVSGWKLETSIGALLAVPSLASLLLTNLTRFIDWLRNDLKFNINIKSQKKNSLTKKKLSMTMSYVISLSLRRGKLIHERGAPHLLKYRCCFCFASF